MLFRSTNNQVISTGLPITASIPDVNNKLIKERIVEGFEFFSENPDDPQYIVNREIAPIPQYPESPNPEGKWSSNALSNSVDIYNRKIEEFQNKILDSVLIKLRNSYANFSIVPESIKQSVLEGPQPKVDLWGTFKAINDKWIAGNDFKQKTLFEDVLLLDREIGRTHV